MNVPNLDCMSEDELMAFWKRYSRPSRKDAEALIGDRCKGFTTMCGRLAGYAANKATAISCRLRGDIQVALSYENICDAIYDRIPEDIRW